MRQVKLIIFFVFFVISSFFSLSALFFYASSVIASTTTTIPPNAPSQTHISQQPPATAPTPINRAEPVSHKATYDVTFECDPQSDFAHADGTMTMEIIRYIDHWIMKQSSALKISIPGIDETETTSTTITSIEDHKGLNYTFTAQALRDDNIDESINGRGRLAGEEGAGTVMYEGPEPLTVNLPEKTYFPIQHLKLLMQEAKSLPPKSFKMVKAIVFDGSSDVREAVRVEAILTAVDPQSKFIGVSDPNILKSHKLWRAEMSVYNISEDNSPHTYSEPEYKIIQIFSEQGIIYKMTVDYGDYKMHSILKEVVVFTDEHSAETALKMGA